MLFPERHQDNIFRKLIKDGGDVVAFSIVPGITFFILLVLGLVLPVLAFGKGSHLNDQYKLLIGVGEPAIIVGMIFNHRFSNAVIIIWGLLCYAALILSTFGIVAYFLVKAYIEMF